MRKFYFLFIFTIYSILSFTKDITFTFNVPVGKIEYFTMGDINTQSQLFYNGTTTLNLDKKEYYFLFSADDYSNIQKVINISEVDAPIEIIFSKNNTAIVQGKVRCNDATLGNVQLSFIDAENHSFNFITNIYGEYTAYISPGNYKIIAQRDGYKIKEKSELIYEFSSKATPYFLDIYLEEISSYIQGQVVDEEGMAIPFPEISIKNGNTLTKITGDNQGIFHLPVESGIVTILCQKNGFLQNGLVRKIDKNTFLNNIEIPLTRVRYSITGTILSDTQALKNIKLQLVTEDFNKIATTTSSENGFFEFYKIFGNQKVYILVFKDNQIIKKSELIDLNRDIKNFNILVN